MKTLEGAFAVPYRYRVHFTSDLFSARNPLLREVVAEGGELPSQVLVVLDRGVLAARPGLARQIEAYCQRHADVLTLTAPPLVLRGGEAAKNEPRHLDELRGAMEEAALCRHSFVVAVGGGGLVDLAGYAAATAHRGIRLIRVPTTVLAQADSAVGVKNGVNAFGKKNWLGAFAPPYAVLNDSAFLETLSDRDWRAGTSESVKVAMIKDAAFFDFIERRAEALARRSLPDMLKLIERCAEIHVDHIASGGDPFELGSARPLDFGHWSAHKLEQLSDYGLRHGEAVAIGIALDTVYSHLAGHLSLAARQRVLKTLSRLGFRLYDPELGRDLEGGGGLAVMAGLEEFREHLGGRLTITLVRSIGEAFEVHEMDPAIVERSIGVLERRDRALLKRQPRRGETTWESRRAAAQG